MGLHKIIMKGDLPQFEDCLSHELWKVRGRPLESIVLGSATIHQREKMRILCEKRLQHCQTEKVREPGLDHTAWDMLCQMNDENMYFFLVTKTYISSEERYALWKQQDTQQMQRCIEWYTNATTLFWLGFQDRACLLSRLPYDLYRYIAEEIIRKDLNEFIHKQNEEMLERQRDLEAIRDLAIREWDWESEEDFDFD